MSARPTPRWERRFRAPVVTLPTWAPASPDRLVFASNESGSWQLYAWDRTTGTRRKVTDDPIGISDGTMTPDGGDIVWFLDEAGDEYGHYVVAPFEGGPARPLVDGAPDGWPNGLAMRDGVIALAQGERDGFAVYSSIDGAPAHEVFRHPELVDLGGSAVGGFNRGGLSADGSLLCFEHAEHGDPLHPALRVVDARTGERVADLWDGPGKGLAAWVWSPVAGDQRLAIRHELEDAGRPAIWDPTTGKRTNLRLDYPGEVEDIWDWWPDGSAILVSLTVDGRDRLVRVGADPGHVVEVEHPKGTVAAARVRDNGEIWLRASDGAHQSTVVSTAGSEIVAPDGESAPDGRPYESWEFLNERGQRVHGFLVTPEAEGPFPLVMEIHGGPTWAWLDAFSPAVQAWVDHGFAVALINYRGSTGYGNEWRDYLIGNPGFPEVEDTIAGLDDLIERGIVDPERVVVSGTSWGGYVTLLSIGKHPDRWAAAVAGVPVADYVAAFEDEAPSLQAVDRGLFGGGPDDFPDLYRERSPITYVDRVKTPLLVLAGENDSRCPIRQIDNYLAAMRDLGLRPEVYRYDTGHASYVVDERVRQMAAAIRFVMSHVRVDTARTGSP
jgi:dipeptidyl aminopeptidase/acylaminoacyl peptidase